MKKLLAATAVLIALAPATALAGDTSCSGKVDVGPKWITVVDMLTTPSVACRFETGTALAKRILRVCPEGSQCRLTLSLYDWPMARDHHDKGDGFYTIVGWPENGVLRLKDNWND